jgi:hypothetical protein
MKFTLSALAVAALMVAGAAEAGPVTVSFTGNVTLNPDPVDAAAFAADSAVFGSTATGSFTFDPSAISGSVSNTYLGALTALSITFAGGYKATVTGADIVTTVGPPDSLTSSGFTPASLSGTPDPLGGGIGLTQLDLNLVNGVLSDFLSTLSLADFATHEVVLTLGTDPVEHPDNVTVSFSVPEPTTLPLLGLALGWLGLTASRRRQPAASAMAAA